MTAEQVGCGRLDGARVKAAVQRKRERPGKRIFMNRICKKQSVALAAPAPSMRLGRSAAQAGESGQEKMGKGVRASP